MLLALGAIRRTRKPSLVTEETNTDPETAEQGIAAATVTHDPMFCLQDSFGTVKWNQDTGLPGDTFFARYSCHV